MPRTPRKEKHELNRVQVDEFELVHYQLERFHAELQGLSKGKGNDALNNFKLTLLNNLLVRAHDLLGSRYEAIADFKIFDAEQLPSTSDALLVVSQYLGALEKLRADNIGQKYASWYWMIDGVLSDVRAAPPAKLRKT